MAASSVAALFALVSGVLLLRGFSKPVEALMQGTDAIASGNLSHRITLTTQDEFGYLATHFNHMACELERQREKLHEANAILEQRVAERTRELHRLNGELQRMDTARREFLADISHELRTPITVICGEAEVILREGDGKCDADDYRETLQYIAGLSTQLGAYVNDLLFLARTELSDSPMDWDLAWEKLDLAELVACATEDIQAMAREGSIAVIFDEPTTAVWVQGDRQRLRLVLFILGDNACRYSNSGSHIAITLHTDGKSASFSLADQGIGIPASDLGLVFERHFRSANARHTRRDGAGLGLPMARSILKAHGGQIVVASAEGEGSTFTATLPLVS
jgi:signal transduction histidine kinase